MRPHTRNCWFDGRAYLCAAQHVRGVASDEGDRWDMDESRQVDELLSCEDSTFRWESPAREIESAIGHSGSALSGQCSKTGENRGSDSARDSGERISSNCVINVMVSESQRYGRVVCLSVRKIFEKLKSLCPLRRLHVAPLEEAGETASSTWEKGRAYFGCRVGS